MWKYKITKSKAHVVALSLVVIFVFVFNATETHATSYTSGPNGTEVNGWYKDSVDMTFQWQHNTFPGDNWIGICASNDTQWNGYSPAWVTFNFKLSGRHTYDFTTNTHGDIYVSIDSQQPQPVIAVCNVGTTFYPYPPDPNSVLWQGRVDVDNSNPTVSITTPVNNSNVSGNSVVISGTVTDSASGISKVVVNGQQATLFSNGFSVSLPLVQGLNTLSATAYDQVGHTSTSSSVVVFSLGPAGSNSNVQPNSSTNTNSDKSSGSKQGVSNPTIANTFLTSGSASPGSTGAINTQPSSLNNPSSNTKPLTSKLSAQTLSSPNGIMIIAFSAASLFILTMLGLIMKFVFSIRSNGIGK